VATRPCCVMRCRHMDWYLRSKRSKILVKCGCDTCGCEACGWVWRILPFPDTLLCLRIPLKHSKKWPFAQPPKSALEMLPNFHFRLYSSFLSFSFTLCLEGWPSSIFGPGIQGESAPLAEVDRSLTPKMMTLSMIEPVRVVSEHQTAMT
jgi:hypothetical protein